MLFQAILKMPRKLLEMGFKLGIGGIVTLRIPVLTK